jgi:hypothetical protein
LRLICFHKSLPVQDGPGTASRRPVVDFDETGFSLPPVNLCRSGYRHWSALKCNSSEAETA